MGKDREDLLFPSTHGGFMALDGWRDAVHWERHAMGRRVYDLRHTFATSALMDGVNLLTLQAWLGHASISTTEKYLHLVGTDADTTALARFNAAAEARRLESGGAGGTRLES